MAEISHEMYKLFEELRKIEPQVTAAHVHLNRAKAKFKEAQVGLIVAQTELDSAEKQDAGVKECKAALLKKVVDLVKIEAGQDASPQGTDPLFLRKCSELELSARANNCLRFEDIDYIGDLVQLDERQLLKIPNLGRTSLNEIKKVLDSHGLTLGMTWINWPPADLKRPGAQ